MKPSLLDELDELLGEKTEEAVPGPEAVLFQHLALAAQVSGVDLSDDQALDDFIGQVKTAVTKDRASLKTQLRRWTAGKARAAVRAVKGTV